MPRNWMKMTIGLDHEPEVIALSAPLGCDIDTVLGKLYRLWGWAADHCHIDATSLDGDAIGITYDWIDDFVRLNGFANALSKVSWLRSKKNGIVLPKVGKYIGAIAKVKAGNALRQSNHRAKKSRSTVTKSVTQPVTRLDKSRGDKNKKPPTPFDIWYSAYPRKAKPDRAERAYEKAVKQTTHEHLLLRAQQFAEANRKTEQKYIPHPSTWLNDGCWKQDPAEYLDPKELDKRRRAEAEKRSEQQRDTVAASLAKQRRLEQTPEYKAENKAAREAAALAFRTGDKP